ncbi:MAG: hypothetical protein JO306_11785, partial [Gemmatimonadetes bacterium]|nr:hypothetical protein [Gemmatimonadota bacterium]
MSDNNGSPVPERADPAAQAASRASTLRRGWALIAGVAVVVVIAMGAVLATSAHRRHAGLVRGLAAAGVHRTFVPRLSIETAFQPCVLTGNRGEIVAAECRGAQADASGGDLATLQRRISGAADAGDPEGIHADALVDLVWGELSTDRLDRVVEQLRQLVRADRAPNADLLADFSAALLIHAGRRKWPLDLYE